jgi:hypothetical protein
MRRALCHYQRPVGLLLVDVVECRVSDFRVRVFFFNGLVFSLNKSDVLQVWCVRGGMNAERISEARETGGTREKSGKGKN